MNNPIEFGINEYECVRAIRKGMWSFFSPFVYGFFLVLLFSGIFHYLPIWKDDTDPENGRSGMVVKTDNLTGCQYLESRTGLTPRFDIEGVHVGCGQ